jgi:protein-disulfide isomerase
LKNKDNLTILKYVLIGMLCIWIGYLLYQYKSIKNPVVTGEYTGAIDFLPTPSALDHYKWKSDSPYTLVNYFSMDCPHCRALDTIEDENKTTYQKAFTLIYRHSPLDIQPLSAGKAAIAECVYNQSGDEKMFVFISDTYSHYQAVAKNNEWVVGIAKKYVSDSILLKQCIVSDGARRKIEQQKIQALSYGVTGTPTIAVFKSNILIFRLDTRGDAVVKRVIDYIVIYKK